MSNNPLIMILHRIMRRPLVFIASFALSGFLIAAAIYGYYSYFYDFTKTTALGVVTDIVTLILCPPSLLSLACIDCEVGTGAGLVWFSFIALVNGGLYAGIAAVVLNLRKRHGNP